MAGRPPSPGAPPPKAPRKRKKRKVKLTLKSRSLKEDTYVDRRGWTTNATSRKLTDDETPKSQPDFIKHQCTGCGYVLKVPRPKRDRYVVECPSCETKDEFGI